MRFWRAGSSGVESRRLQVFGERATKPSRIWNKIHVSILQVCCVSRSGVKYVSRHAHLSNVSVRAWLHAILSCTKGSRIMVYYLNAVHNKNEIFFVACVHVCPYSSQNSNCTMGVKSPMAYVFVFYLHIAGASEI